MDPLNRKSLPAVAAIPLIALLSFVASSHAISANALRIMREASHLFGITSETDVRAPVDFGAGPGVTPKAQMKRAKSTGNDQIPDGGAAANVTGAFGAAVTWPIIPIHSVLLPDGRVMSYGTDQSGQQGAQLIYDVWDPTLGTDASAHTELPNTTGTDIFCSSQSVMLSGSVLISGGDLTVNGVRNFARNDTNVFSPSTNTLNANTPMQYARWYGSLVSMSDGKLVVLGGIQNVLTANPEQPVSTPEEYDPATQVWTPLTGASSMAAFGNNNNWYYPRSYVAPGGNIFVLGIDGTMYSVSTAGAGSITNYAVTMSPGSETLPTVPFAPGKVLTVRANQEVDVVDFSGPVPVVTQTDSIDQVRLWSSGTILADGKVLITGGSEVANATTGVAYQAQIWDPATGHWTAGASATKPRLYHSNSMLLTDATVLTGGGGAPGPVNNLNAEIYYPPYLYDSTGAAAVRPVITAAAPLNPAPGGTISLTVGPADSISSLTFIRMGSATHSNNSDQRFITLPFTQTGQNLSAVLPADPTVLLPGYYMLFAFNQAGVPSVATVLSVDAQVPVPVTSPVTASLSTSQVTITAGQSVTLTWNSANASSCSATGGTASDAWTGAKATSGTATFTDASVPADPLSVIYTLTCTSDASGQAAQASATITEEPSGGNSGGGGTSTGGSDSGGGSSTGGNSGGSGSSTGGNSGGSGSSTGGNSGGSGSSTGSDAGGSGAAPAKSGGGGSFDVFALIFLFGVAGWRFMDCGRPPARRLTHVSLTPARDAVGVEP